MGQAYLREGVAKYQLMLQRYCKLDIREVKEQADPEREAAALRALLAGRCYTVVLSPEGRQCRTEALAAHLAQLAQRGYPAMSFVIGGAYGLAEHVVKQADEVLSLSRLTFPHQLCRLLVLEQLYRCFSLNGGHPYHK